MAEEPEARIVQKLEGDNNSQSLIVFKGNYGTDGTLERLFNEYREEQAKNAEFNSIIAELQHYLLPVATEREYIGLKRKLEDGGRSYLYDYAEETKEIFYKKVVKYQLSESAQKVFLYLLSDVFSKFNSLIYPCLIENLDGTTIRKMIDAEIVDYVMARLGSNIFEIYKDSVYGMIYFLTGNCHIRWK